MPDPIDNKAASGSGFDARKTLEQFEPPKPQPDRGGITMGVPSNADMERDAARREAMRALAARRDDNTINESSYIPARILWPALGFPAVIDPNGNDRSIAARGICLLLLSDRDPNSARKLANVDVARHLRIVPWSERRTRWLKTREQGESRAFAEEDIDTRPVLATPGKDSLTERVLFAADADGLDGVCVGLSKTVREFYGEVGLKHLYEVRIAPQASAAVAAQGKGPFHLLWINPKRKGKQDDASNRSAEMDTLLEKHVPETRFGHDGLRDLDNFVGKTRAAQIKKYTREYEYEFQFDHGQTESAETRVEVLHPVFIGPGKDKLRIGHLTDLHVDIRPHTYERNLSAAGASGRLHSWNEATANLYAKSKGTCDLLLLTGDLIDYGRGHNEGGPLAERESYWRDRNWFLFYEMLASGMRYAKPAYTILGNHDWRINPYPPLTTGAPEPKEMNLTKDEVKTAHGPGADRYLFYGPRDLTKVGKFVVGAKRKIWDSNGSLELAGTPLETRVESVLWYLLLINPFLDYACLLPGGYDLLMLDWAEDETVDHTVIKRGEDTGRTTLLPNTEGGPWARNCLTGNQQAIVTYVAEKPTPAKIVGIHAPPIGPWSEWGDDGLLSGWIHTTSSQPVRGRTFHNVKHADLPQKFQVQAFRKEGDPFGREATCGTIGQAREWFIRTLHDTRFQLVFSGHIHRQNLLVLEGARKQNAPLLVKALNENDAPRAVQPLFVNSTSVGPLGHVYPRNREYEQRPSGYTEVVLTNRGSVDEVRFVSDPSNVLLQPKPAGAGKAA